MVPAEKNDGSGERPDRYHIRERIGEPLREYYSSYATEELPPRLLALIKKLEEESDPTE
jgi:anti-sigma factor NepR-like protein